MAQNAHLYGDTRQPIVGVILLLVVNYLSWIDYKEHIFFIRIIFSDFDFINIVNFYVLATFQDPKGEGSPSSNSNFFR